jgi:hypothetical protein
VYLTRVRLEYAKCVRLFDSCAWGTKF